jgi:uncharacterized protein (DUF1810 family)
MVNNVRVIHIDNNDILEGIQLDTIEAFMFAEGGAMGRPGELKYFCLEDNKLILYKGNRYSEGINKDTVNGIFSALNDKLEWFDVYLGMGNHLCLKPEYQSEFEAARNSSEKHIYKAYEEIVFKILYSRVGPYSLSRFIEAQEEMYEIALDEVREGQKRSHWMWYVFPQLRGLGKSPMAQKYALENKDEAKAYLDHPILSARLKEISQALLMLNKRNPEEIFGYTDSIKLRSSMTLFAYISERGSVFHRVIEQYFYGDMDGLTLKMLEK